MTEEERQIILTEEKSQASDSLRNIAEVAGDAKFWLRVFGSSYLTAQEKQRFGILNTERKED